MPAGGCRARLGQGRPPDPPFPPASAFGDPHFVTFDGANFTFNGHGEYVLLEASLTNLTVQARAQPDTTPEGEAGPGAWGSQAHPWGKAGAEQTPFYTHHPGTQARGTGLTAVAVQEGDSDVVEVRLAGGAGVLQVLLNQEVLSFAEQSWMDLKGEWVASCPHWAPHLSPALAGGGVVSRARAQRQRPLRAHWGATVSPTPCTSRGGSQHNGRLAPAHGCLWTDVVLGPGYRGPAWGTWSISCLHTLVTGPRGQDSGTCPHGGPEEPGAAMIGLRLLQGSWP